MDLSVFDYLIVGAGFAGSVCAERLAAAGKRVCLIDRRAHLGGAAHDTTNEAGLLVNPYGPHLFHTNSREVVDYLSRFTGWRPYEHRVLSCVHGRLYPFPINFDTINTFYGLRLTADQLPQYLAKLVESPPNGKVWTSEDAIVARVGRDLYEQFFRHYTRKQWGVDPSELDASVAGRVPVRLTREDRYFTDQFQAQPCDGYTALFRRMVHRRGIAIQLRASYRDVARVIPHHELIYTGAIDEYFGYQFGRLPYRSVRLQFQTMTLKRFQPVAVVNYPGADVPFTRITEFKHYTGQQDHHETTVALETPCSATESDADPLTPVPTPANRVLYERYRVAARARHGVHFCGRLGSYQYLNMDQVVAQALGVVAELLGRTRQEVLCLP